MMRAHLFDAVPPLRDPALRGTLLDLVIQKALTKDRDKRFRTANDMLLAMAGEPVARPLIHGLSLSALDEPSTDDLRLDEPRAPNTDDYDFLSDGTLGEHRTSTLSFTSSVDKGNEASEDAVPFGSVGATAPPDREREAIASGLTKTGGSSVSSIITVIGDASDREPILLTKKKSSTPRAPQAAPAAPQRPAAPTPAPGERTPPPSDDARTQTAGGKNWEWSQDGSMPVPHPAQSPGGSVPAWLIVLVVGVIVLALIGVFYADIIAILGLGG